MAAATSLWLRFGLLCAIAVPAFSATYYVSESGDDGHPGTRSQPFRTIQKAADSLNPGDTCFVRGGIYRETVELKRSGSLESPVRVAAYPGETVLLDGTEPISGEWTVHQGKIYKVKTERKFEQLFVEREMMLEARWPNTTFDKLFTREGWATTGKKSGYQKLHDPELAQTGIDWTGATAVLNVAHQFWTWSRPVLNHSNGSDTFEYRIKMNEFHSRRTHWWADDAYYLVGKLEALDSPNEWFLDRDGTLYLWAPDGGDPSERQVTVKTRDYAFQVKGVSHVRISGFHFFGCTFTLEDSEHCVVEHCNLRFPSFARGVPDSEEPPRKSAGTRVIGSENTIRSCSLVYCSNFGIQVRGRRNVVENCLIHDVNWSGTLRYTGIALRGNRDDEKPMNVARRNTVYNVGNTIINSGRNPYGIIEYNHVHHGGVLSKDVSLIYTNMPWAMGNEIRYNWVHHSLSPSNSLGIRGDDKTRGLRVHHNVIWSIRRDAIIVKGGLNRVYNNTCFANGAGDILFCSGREPDKWWQKHVKAYVHQNEDSLLINNTGKVIVSTRRRSDPGLPGDHSNNDTTGAQKLADPAQLDFRPREDSPLIDAGRVVEGVTAPFAGKAPDIGAYEYGGEHWLPGHHNGVAVSLSDEEELQAALWMPILEELELKVAADGRDLAPLSYTPENWMRPQAIETGDARPESVRFERASWGAAAVSVPEDLNQTVTLRAQFERPDLTSAKGAGPKFSYHEVYQPVKGFKPTARAFRTETPITIDGKLDAAEWPGLTPERTLPLISLKTSRNQTFPPAGTAAILFDEANLYLAFSIPGHTRDLSQDADEWGRDVGVEFDFRTVIKKEPGPIFVLHGFPSGKTESVTDAGATEKEAQRLGQSIEYAARIAEDEWTAELRIPFSAMGVALKALDHLRFNVGARNNTAEGGPWFAWQPTGGANYDVDSAAILALRPAVAAKSPSLLTNGAFESIELAPWQLSSNSRDPIPDKTAMRAREGRDGGWCIRLQCLDEKVMSERVFKWLHPVPGDLAPGRYHLSYDVRTQGPTPRGKMGSFNSYIHVRRGGRPGGNIGQTESMIEKDAAEWVRRDFVLTIPEGVEPSMLSLQLHRATGTVWLDNVSFVPVR